LFFCSHHQFFKCHWLTMSDVKLINPLPNTVNTNKAEDKKGFSYDVVESWTGVTSICHHRTWFHHWRNMSVPCDHGCAPYRWHWPHTDTFYMEFLSHNASLHTLRDSAVQPVSREGTSSTIQTSIVTTRTWRVPLTMFTRETCRALTAVRIITLPDGRIRWKTCCIVHTLQSKGVVTSRWHVAVSSCNASHTRLIVTFTTLTRERIAFVLCITILYSLQWTNADQ